MPHTEVGLHWDLTKRIIAAFYEVRRELGPWFPEYVYSNAMVTALAAQNLRALREVPYEVVFRGVVAGLCRADLVVENKILVESKIVRIIPPHRDRARHYLIASRLKVAVILNFGENASTARVEVP